MRLKAKGYSGQSAIFLAAICSQTYTQFMNTDGTFVVPAAYEVAAAFKAKSVDNAMQWFGYILESAQDIIVVFRGTSSTSDWAADLMATQVPYPNVRRAGLTHRGITAIYQSAREQIISALGQLPVKPIFVTGHSLGGALATLCAIDIAVNTPFRNPKTYTFGSPRVGDGSFANAYADEVPFSYRVNNPFDAVTHIPPFIFKLPRQSEVYYYTHVRHSISVPFQNGSLSANHIIGSYFAELSKQDKAYTKQMCAANPGLCPSEPI